MSATTINWVLTHEPIALFEEAARRFQQIVHDESDGELEVNVMTPTELGEGVRVPPLEVAKQVARGELQMSQTYTVALGKLHERLWVLDLPFLFESHEHAAGVLDGAIGRELLDGLLPHGLRGLAFTYSGGYRIISSTGAPIRTVEDFAGLDVRTSDNPVVVELMKELGARPHPAPLQAIPSLTEAGTIQAAESTWPRYWDMEHYRAQSVVNETSHSLFLTALVINDEFFRGLPERLQQVLARAALTVAALERDKSVRDGAEARRAHEAAGGTVHTMSAAETERLARIAQAVHAKFGPVFGEDLVARIRSAAWSATG